MDLALLHLSRALTDQKGFEGPAEATGPRTPARVDDGSQRPVRDFAPHIDASEAMIQVAMISLLRGGGGRGALFSGNARGQRRLRIEQRDRHPPVRRDVGIVGEERLGVGAAHHGSEAVVGQPGT